MPASAFADYGATPASVMWFDNWGRRAAFPVATAEALWRRNVLPHFTWEQWDPALALTDPGQIRLDAITSGQWDDYIAARGREFARYGGPLIVRWGHEFNGNWCPWAVATNNQNPRAYRRVHDIVCAQGARDVQWCWAYNNGPSPAADWNDEALAYPGGAYVDWIGIDKEERWSLTPGLPGLRELVGAGDHGRPRPAVRQPRCREPSGHCPSPHPKQRNRRSGRRSSPSPRSWTVTQLATGPERPNPRSVDGAQGAGAELNGLETAAADGHDRPVRGRLWLPALVNLGLGVLAMAPLHLARWLVVNYLPMDCKSVEDVARRDLVNCDYTTLDHAGVVMFAAVVTGALLLVLALTIDVLLPLRRGRRLGAWLGMALLIPVPFVVWLCLT
ncbi:glycosyl hydrolase [Kutzneria sp. CA-103260]|uniref:glycosyl hydrolase n=1 Tax=Kutzneria sp. CA-103260 TaxID=2802641 RepID=UPI001BA54352|nr:glycosyl hydrolase [Kutzneria sp. CA-103260]